MIKRVKHSSIDFKKWDAAITANPDKHNWFMFSWYLNAVAPTWDALVYKDYQAVFPLVKRWRGIKFYYQPFFTRAFEIMGNGVDNNIEKKIYDTLNSGTSYGSVNIENSHFLEGNANYQVLDIQLCTYSQNTKRNIKKAEKAGVEIEDIDIELFMLFYVEHNSKKFKEYKSKHYKQLKKLLLAAHEKGFLHLKRSFLKSTVAVAAYLVSGEKALYLCAAINSEGKSVGASHYMVHRFIETNKRQISTLDFGGSNISGVARFYKGFGAEDKQYSIMPVGHSKK